MTLSRNISLLVLMPWANIDLCYAYFLKFFLFHHLMKSLMYFFIPIFLKICYQHVLLFGCLMNFIFFVNKKYSHSLGKRFAMSISASRGCSFHQFVYCVLLSTLINFTIAIFLRHKMKLSFMQLSESLKVVKQNKPFTLICYIYYIVLCCICINSET